ncbi:Uncharacterised protein [Serratia quinivorans]|uniref:hypothetical protein n=1 Tax=Serratia quinivorans TaxID=137545 RepID=UPI00217BE392|nr:hypothetical protein [Serratia quinivorans]CAI1770878.1 Uncharacterised protein [Serratia quinivorans]
MKKSDKQVWFELGQSIRLAREKARANERERDHIERQHDTDIAPEVAPKLREALQKAKGGR